MGSENKFFRWAIIISLGFHLGILLLNPQWGLLKQLDKEKEQNVEVRYLEVKDLKLPKSAAQRIPEALLNLPTKMKVDPVPSVPSLDKEEVFSKSRVSIGQRINTPKPVTVVKPEMGDIRKKITITPESFEKIASPAYLSHSSAVRGKLEKALYENYGSELGQATLVLSFVLTRDGFVKEAKIVEEKSSTSHYFNNLTIECVRAAAPYPPFPKELDYDELPFRVTVSFEAE